MEIDEQGPRLWRCSRTQAQQRCKAEYLDLLLPGDILPCRVTHLESFGAFCDIGCGVPALLPIDCMSVSRIQSPADRVHEGQDILCAVKSRDTEGRIVLTMKELLGTWLENAAAFAAGETVVGLVRSVEPYGVFVELAPNLAGLAEAAPGLDCGQLVSVYIKSIIPEKMKIKLVVLHAMRDETFAFPLEYRLHAGHIRRWIYSVPGAARVIETIFDG
ncbi:MAG: S1 RNA-binding domain-containing protein [Ruthenibacterium lactatiformans]